MNILPFTFKRCAASFRMTNSHFVFLYLRQSAIPIAIGTAGKVIFFNKNLFNKGKEEGARR
jgi:hypothetical protein